MEKNKSAKLFVENWRRRVVEQTSEINQMELDIKNLAQSIVNQGIEKGWDSDAIMLQIDKAITQYTVDNDIDYKLAKKILVDLIQSGSIENIVIEDDEEEVDIDDLESMLSDSDKKKLAKKMKETVDYLVSKKLKENTSDTDYELPDEVKDVLDKIIKSILSDYDNKLTDDNSTEIYGKILNATRTWNNSLGVNAYNERFLFDWLNTELQKYEDKSNDDKKKDDEDEVLTSSVVTKHFRKIYEAHINRLLD